MKTIAQLINWDFKTNGKLVIEDKKGNRIYFELADGFWAKREYDSQCKEIYFENSDGFWAKYEYDFQGYVIYFENSDGQIIDNRHKPSEDRLIEIDGVKYKLIKL
jgi:hypothetical protein